MDRTSHSIAVWRGTAVSSDLMIATAGGALREERAHRLSLCR